MTAAVSATRGAALLAAIDAAGLEGALLTDHAAVSWLAGTGARPGQAVLVSEGSLTIVDIGDEDLPPLRGAIGVQTSALGAAWAALVAGHPLFDLTPAVDALRSRLDDGELAAVRRASAAATLAQTTFRGAIAEGGTEREADAAVFDAVRSRFGPVEAIVDLMFGDRCGQVGMPPTERRLAAGETALLDFAPRLGGYWSDSCATIVVGRPPSAVTALHDAARRALDAAIELVRPGVPVREIDRLVRRTMEDAGYRYPHLTGHGVGLKQQDHPLITSSSAEVLAEGQVLAIEPGGYAASYGVRVEHVFRVGHDGAEILTEHSLELSR